MEAVFPIADERHELLQVLAGAIATAHNVNGSSWSVSRQGSGISLNVGPNRALGVSADLVGFIGAGHEPELVMALTGAGIEAALSRYKFPEATHYVTLVAAADSGEAMSALSEQFTAAVAASATRNTPYHKSFSEEVIVYIEEALGIELPRPATQPPVIIAGARA